MVSFSVAFIHSQIPSLLMCSLSFSILSVPHHFNFSLLPHSFYFHNLDTLSLFSNSDFDFCFSTASTSASAGCTDILASSLLTQSSTSLLWNWRRHTSSLPGKRKGASTPRSPSSARVGEFHLVLPSFLPQASTSNLLSSRFFLLARATCLDIQVEENIRVVVVGIEIKVIEVWIIFEVRVLIDLQEVYLPNPALMVQVDQMEQNPTQ